MKKKNSLLSLFIPLLSLSVLHAESFQVPGKNTRAEINEPVKPAAAIAVADWESLYNGTLEGFRIYFRGQGYLSDGMQQEVFTAHSDYLHVRKGTNGLIVKEVPYTHYHVRVDYRWGKEKASMNAGLMTHVDLTSRCVKDNRPQSVEINMLHKYPGSIWLASKLGPYASTTIGPDRKTYLPEAEGGEEHHASPFSNRTIYARYPVQNTQEAEGGEELAGPNTKPHGEWNTLEAIVRGADSVEIIHNGVLVNKITDLKGLAEDGKSPGEPLLSGGIGLQSEGQEVFYRNFQVRKL